MNGGMGTGQSEDNEVNRHTSLEVLENKHSLPASVFGGLWSSSTRRVNRVQCSQGLLQPSRTKPSDMSTETNPKCATDALVLRI
jgi:hypothetical protein